MAEEEFDFESEFALLDIGATSSMLRTGAIRPTVLAFSAAAGVEAIALDWSDSKDAAGVSRAFEEARRYARDMEPVAYAFISHLTLNGQMLVYHLPGSVPSPANEFLGLAMAAEDGSARGILYPVRRAGASGAGGEVISFGMPTVTDSEAIEWCPIGDLWGNPFCVGDQARFRPRERAVDPTTPLWQAIVELTRLRMHEDRAQSEEYMSFLDDLRNGVFQVVGRPNDDPSRVLLRPRTAFNPLGTLNVEASRLLLAERVEADVHRVAGAK